jgi:hypothetical protein
MTKNDRVRVFIEFSISVRTRASTFLRTIPLKRAAGEAAAAVQAETR